MQYVQKRDTSTICVPNEPVSYENCAARRWCVLQSIVGDNVAAYVHLVACPFYGSDDEGKPVLCLVAEASHARDPNHMRDRQSDKRHLAAKPIDPAFLRSTSFRAGTRLPGALREEHPRRSPPP